MTVPALSHLPRRRARPLVVAEGRAIVTRANDPRRHQCRWVSRWCRRGLRWPGAWRARPLGSEKQDLVEYLEALSDPANDLDLRRAVGEIHFVSEAKWEFMARSVQLYPEGEGPIRAFHIAKERGAPDAAPFDKWLAERAVEGWELVSLTPRGDMHHDLYVVFRRPIPSK